MWSSSGTLISVVWSSTFFTDQSILFFTTGFDVGLKVGLSLGVDVGLEGGDGVGVDGSAVGGLVKYSFSFSLALI